MLATRISFMNELANLADTVGADIEAVRRGIGSDPRIGYHFLYAGCGYGGSCFPKDVRALIRTAQERGKQMRILDAVEEVNTEQKSVLVEKICARLGDDLTGKTLAVWGLAFKPNTDDMREAPSRTLIPALLKRGAVIRAYDPVSMEEARRVLEIDLADDPSLGKRLHFCTQQYDAVKEADALVIVTEWKAFKSPDIATLHASLKSPIMFDGRNLFEPENMAELGFVYEAIGRPYVEPK
jgi:UDPglucose 6-dehydrogenase